MMISAARSSGINMYSHLLGEALQDQKIKEENAAAIIHNAASEITHKLGDLVLTVKPGTASLLQLLNRLRDYAAEMAAANKYILLPQCRKAYTDITYLLIPVYLPLLQGSHQ